MAENSWPFENADTTETQFSKWASAFVGTGVISGLLTTVTAGLGLSLASGAAIVRGMYYENTTAKALTVSTPHATQTRKDYVILTLDLAANTVIASVKAGTPTGGGGTFPVLTQTAATWEHPIAEITVPGGAVNLVSGNINPLLSGVGLTVISYTSTAERPNPADPIALGMNTTTKKLELWIGGAWTIVNPDLAIADITGLTAALAGKAASAHTHAQADITGLVAALAAKAPTASPTFTGDVTAPNFVGKLNGGNVFVQSATPAVVTAQDVWIKKP